MAGAVLIAVAAGTARLPGVAAREAAARPEMPRAGADTIRSTRAFAHARHERVGCRECHGTGAQHRTIFVRTPRDCATCHHAVTQTVACTSCHVADSLPAHRVVRAALHLPPDGAPRTRELGFRHDLHLAGPTALGCRECHRADVLLAVDRPCASCHASHHAPQADCSACHHDVKPGVHQASAHLSCAGGSCHATDRAPPPTQSRNTCLVCHPAQRSHEPGGECAACHHIPTGQLAREGQAARRSALP